MTIAELREKLARGTRVELARLADGMASGQYVADPSPYHAELIDQLLEATNALPALLDVVEAATKLSKSLEHRHSPDFGHITDTDCFDCALRASLARLGTL